MAKQCSRFPNNFYKVYLAYDPSIQSKVALKVSNSQEVANFLEREAMILRMLKKVNGVPQILKEGEMKVMKGFINCWKNLKYYVELELLEQTISSFIKEQTNKMDVIKKIGRETVEILRGVHERKVIHRDIKPDNIMIKEDKIYLIDYGVSYHERCPDFYWRQSLIGTVLFAPISAHKQEKSAYKDDLESLSYTLIFLLKEKGELPWQKKSIYSLSSNAANHLNQISEQKANFPRAFFHQLPAFLREFHTYVMNLQPDDEIDYESLLKLFSSASLASKEGKQSLTDSFLQQSYNTADSHHAYQRINDEISLEEHNLREKMDRQKRKEFKFLNK